MRVVVTGAAGFVGSHVCDALVADGHEVVGVDAFIDYYPREDKLRNLEPLSSEPRFTLVERDLRSDPLDDVLRGADAVIHEAAMPGLSQSWTRFNRYVTCNVQATYRLVEAARATGVPRLLHISTSSVYGTNAVGDESAATMPMSPYGVTKLAAEHLVLAYATVHRLPAVILRYFSIYGPRQRPDMAYHIFIDAILAGRTVTVYGDGLATRTNTFVSDCVDGTLRALRGGEVGEIYNIGGGESITVLEAINLIADALGKTALVEHGPERPGDQRHTRANVEKARRAFGYQPRIGPREGLARQAAWQRAGTAG
jgi:nucleoside-diphosphate-sugar epimerase